MPVPTVTEFNEAKEDLDDLEALVNGFSSVETRIGGTKQSYSQLMSKVTHGTITTYDPSTTYTTIDQWVSYTNTSVSPNVTTVYRPIPDQLPIAPTSPLTTAPDTNKWVVAAGDIKHYIVNNYEALRALTSSNYTDGQVIFVTDEDTYGQFIVKTGTVTDNSIDQIVFNDDPNRYAERRYPVNGVYQRDYATSAQAIIDEIESSPGQGVALFTPAKSYNESVGTVISSQRVALKCLHDDQKGATLNYSASDVDGVTFNQAHGYINGLKIKGFGASSTKNGVLMATNSKWYRASNLEIEDFNIGFHSQDAVTSVIDKVYVLDCNTSYKIDTQNTSITAISSWCNRSTALNSSVGWEINNAAYSNFISCAADGMGDVAWKLVGGSSINLLGSGCEGNAVDDPDQAIVISDGVEFVAVKNFFAFSCGNAGQGAMIQVTDGVGTTRNINLQDIYFRNPNDNTVDDFDIDCEGPVFIQNAIRVDSSVYTKPTFTNVRGLHEYYADWTATMEADSGTITLSIDTLRIYRRGRMIRFDGYLEVDSVSSPTGTIVVKLPWRNKNATKNRAMANVASRDLTYGGSNLVGVILDNSFDLTLKSPVSGGNWTNPTIAAGAKLYVSGQYETEDGYTFPAGMSISDVSLNE